MARLFRLFVLSAASSMIANATASAQRCPPNSHPEAVAIPGNLRTAQCFCDPGFISVQGLCVRFARNLNRLMGKPGRVFADHFHSRLLRSPTELAVAIAYVMGNHVHHFGGPKRRDPFSSAAVEREEVLARPRTWLIRRVMFRE